MITTPSKNLPKELFSRLKSTTSQVPTAKARLYSAELRRGSLTRNVVTVRVSSPPRGNQQPSVGKSLGKSWLWHYSFIESLWNIKMLDNNTGQSLSSIAVFFSAFCVYFFYRHINRTLFFCYVCILHHWQGTCLPLLAYAGNLSGSLRRWGPMCTLMIIHFNLFLMLVACPCNVLICYVNRHVNVYWNNIFICLI